MSENLKKYNEIRDFKKTKEPVGKKIRKKDFRFCVQHHIATHDHYDFRLEYDGVLISFAVPKGPSYNPKDKRLAIKVENHPVSYINFEGVIEKGQYGAGVVMLFDIGKYKEIEKFKDTLNKGYLKFELFGSRLKGKWTLVRFKDNNWLLIKDNDNVKLYDDINEFNTSIKSNKKIEDLKDNIKITHPDKVIYKSTKTTKKDIFNYYQKVKNRMLPFIKNRLLTTVRCPNGIESKFFKKHFDDNPNLEKVRRKNKEGSFENYYYIKDEKGLLSEVQMNSIEFHVGVSEISKNPDIMVFDLDPDENLSIEKLRKGVKDLKEILDSLNLKSYLKTSGGKGYHIYVPIKKKITFNKFEKIAYEIANTLKTKYEDKYTINMQKKIRKNKIFIDYFRNKKGSTIVAPYSIRARNLPYVSMPIKWSELDKIKPNDITIDIAIKRLKNKDPWEDFFK